MFMIFRTQYFPLFFLKNCKKKKNPLWSRFFILLSYLFLLWFYSSEKKERTKQLGNLTCCLITWKMHALEKLAPARKATRTEWIIRTTETFSKEWLLQENTKYWYLTFKKNMCTSVCLAKGSRTFFYTTDDEMIYPTVLNHFICSSGFEWHTF